MLFLFSDISMKVLVSERGVAKSLAIRQPLAEER